MIANTRGIVLRQVKTINGRRVLSLFTERFGKITVGVTVSERGRSGTTLALKPFTCGEYELYCARGTYSMNKGTAIKSFYGIGEDLDKYLVAARGLELCQKLTVEEDPQPELFRETYDFLSLMETRKQRFDTLLLAYKCKLLQQQGSFPDLTTCICCGKREKPAYFLVQEGGMMCESCANPIKNAGNPSPEPLSADRGGGASPMPDTRDSFSLKVDYGILNVLTFILENPILRLEKLALDRGLEKAASQLVDCCITYYLDAEGLTK